MDAFDWFHLLTPLAIGISLANLITGMALMPKYRSAHLKKYSLMSYSGLLTGWTIMKIGTIFTNITVMTSICIIGWLVLMPALLLTTSCFIARLAQGKIKFTATSRKAVYLIYSLFRFCIVGISALFIGLGSIFSSTRKSQTYTFDESPVNQSTFDETVGGQHVFTKHSEGVLGEKYSHPSQDPFSNNWSSQ